MEIYQVRNTQQADDDLESIAEYIAQDNLQSALKFAQKLQDDIKRVLSVFPRKHKAYKDCYVFPYSNYLVLYDISEHQKIVNVLGIVNSAQYLRYKDMIKD